MEKPKEYPLSSFEELCNVINKDNFEDVFKDFKSGLEIYVAMVEMTRIMEPETCEGKSNWEISPFKMSWIDDGKHDLRDIIITHPDSGTKATITFNKPLL